MLLQNTVEGFLADPMYGGNRDFVGWKLIGFPGPALQLRRRDRAVRQALRHAVRRARWAATAARARRLSMATRLPPVDVVLVGFGWTGEHPRQGADRRRPAGARARARRLSRHHSRFRAHASIQDELRYAVRNGLFEEPERETLTFRNDR